MRWALPTSAVTTPNNGYQWSARVDYYLGKNDRIYADAIRTSRTSEGLQSRPATNIPYYDISDYGNVDWTHTFSPRLLNEFSVNMIRPQGANGSTPSEAIPYVNVTGMQGFGTWGAGNFIQTTVGWRDVMSATIKSHTLKFGYDGYNIRENDLQDSAFTRPTYNFDNLLDFVQDKATSESGTHVDLTTHGQAPYVRRYRELYTGFFIQDDWKVTPRFTLNAGCSLRFDGAPVCHPQPQTDAVGTRHRQPPAADCRSSGHRCSQWAFQPPRPHCLWTNAPARIRVGRVRQRQDGAARRRGHVCRSTALSAHHRRDIGQPAVLLFPVDQRAAGRSDARPVPDVRVHPPDSQKSARWSIRRM